MVNRYINPKLKIKFLKESSLARTPVEPGNLIITMDSENVYYDILSSDDEAKRINVSDFYTTEEINTFLSDYYTKSEIDEILSGGEGFSSIANTNLDNLTEQGEKRFPIKPYSMDDTFSKGDIVVYLNEDDKIYFGTSLQDNNTGHTLDEDGWWYVDGIGSKGGDGIRVSICKNMNIKIDGTSVQLKWEDPGDTIIDNKVLASWAGTKIVKKVGGYPENEEDGTIVIDNKEKNKYLENPYEDTISEGEDIYYKAFPYNTEGGYTYNDKNCFVDAIIYEFTINPNDSNPATRVAYPAGCVNENFTPAKMNFSTGAFEYGDWEHAFFQPRPVMVRFDGTIDYELYKNDVTKKADGFTPSDVANTAYAGNAMVAFPQVWLKFKMDGTLFHVYVSNKQVDDTYHCYTHYNKLGVLCDEIFIMMYQPCKDTSWQGSSSVPLMRSISGTTILTNNSGTNEILWAENTNTKATGANWSLWDYAQFQMIGMLLTLMGKSTNTEATYGKGRDSNNANATTGECDKLGMFYGTQTTGPVKIFGIENYYANYWKRCNGCCYSTTDGLRIKLTETTIDGSTVEGYNTDGTGYVANTGAFSGSSGGYISEMVLNENGIFPKVASGSATTYWCDGLWWANGGFALVGGGYVDGSRAGCFTVSLGTAVSHSAASYGGSLCCKPNA